MVRIESLRQAAAGGLLSAACAAALAGTDCRQGQQYTFENDYLGLDQSNTDRWYTTGLQASWSYYLGGCDGPVLALFKDLTRPLKAFAADDELPTVIFGVGQNWYTPEHIDVPTQQLDDRPWAGHAYVSVATSTYGKRDSGRNFHEAIELRLGWVGPASGAQWVQKHAHRLFKDDEPAGWRYQLRPRTTLQASYAVTYRKPLGGDFDWLGLHTHGRVSVGSPRTLAAAGITLVAGERDRVIGAPDEGDLVALDLSERDNRFRGWLKHWTFYAQYQVAAVASNIFITGKTFAEQTRVTRKPIVTLFTVGSSFEAWKGVRLEARNSWRSPDFEAPPTAKAKGVQNYGALRLIIDTSL